MKKRLVITLAASALIGALAVGGTVAYLTDNEVAANTFTIGKVQIDLEEPGFNSDDAQNLVPNQKIAKNPQVENTGTNDAIVFMKVVSPKATLTVAANDGTKGTNGNQEIFQYLTGNQTGFNDHFLQISKEETEKDTAYVFGYKEALSAGQQTEALFDMIQLKNIIEGQIDASTQKVDVKAYAIQATDILDETGADITDETLDVDTLKQIYDVYIKQNDGAQEKEADANGKTNLEGNIIAAE